MPGQADNVDGEDQQFQRSSSVEPENRDGGSEGRKNPLPQVGGKPIVPKLLGGPPTHHLPTQVHGKEGGGGGHTRAGGALGGLDERWGTGCKGEEESEEGEGGQRDSSVVSLSD